MIKLVQKSTCSDDCPPITNIMATGGGAHKFYKLMQKTFKKYQLPMKIIALDEMECLIKGLDWLITKIPHEIFTYDLEDDDTVTIPNTQTASDIYPYLLVNIGSGVSMIKVVGPGKHERIGGSSLGGGTLWGLLTLLTDAKDYNEMLEMAQQGDNNNIDLLVGDIYGTNYNKIGLKSTHIASSFAKVFKKLSGSSSKAPKQLLLNEKLANFRQEDIARSLLYAISNNLGQIAYLHALRFNLKRIYFGGSYISGHKQTIHTLSYAVNFWSKGDMKSYFLRHEGYLGSVGAFMMGPNSEYVDENKTVIDEKYPNWSWKARKNWRVISWRRDIVGFTYIVNRRQRL
jgi:type II pantothenate kinase